MPLTLQPRGYRRLRDNHRVNLISGAEKYFTKMTDVDQTPFCNLDVPLQRDLTAAFDYNHFIIESPTDLVHLLDRFLFPSTDAILKVLDESHGEWSFKTVERLRTDEDGTQPLHPILFCRSVVSGKPQSVKMVIIPIGPWEFGQRDFGDLAGGGLFDDTTDSNAWKITPWTNADKMRAYLYDICLDLDCPFFVVTSYHLWSFGRFSTYYTSACFTLPLPFNNSRVSIIGMLIYWIHSSFGKQRSFNLPTIVAEMGLEPNFLDKERLDHSKRFRNSFPKDVDGIDNQGSQPPKRQRLILTTEVTPDPTINTAPNNYKVKVTETPSIMATDSSGLSTPITQPGLQLNIVSGVSRYRKPNPLLRELLARKKTTGKLNAKGIILGSTDSAPSDISFRSASTTVSRAPSSADPLPEKLIPKKRNEFCESWRNMVALGGDMPTTLHVHKKEVLLPVSNHFTGEWSGDIVPVTEDDRVSSTSSVSECSLTPEELAEYAPKADVRDLEDFPVHQWRFDSTPVLDSTRESEDGLSWAS
ncbi:hypothetical protein BU17DRAFT_89750 [Hysterangium stoloniferum]|nr:hypothetical protein BU17DRAFT_89750 [Hysterangium stoloniferum]